MTDSAEPIDLAKLIARKSAYRDMYNRLTGTAWKVVRFHTEINYCTEKINEIDREIAQWKDAKKIV